MANSDLIYQFCEPEEITVWFSCGAASAVALQQSSKLYAGKNIRAVNNPVTNEDADNRRFLADVSDWLGIEIEEAKHPKYPTPDCNMVWKNRGYMAGMDGAPCTELLKKRARQHWESNNQSDALVLGFTADEKKRADRFRKFERPNLLTPLIETGTTKDDCFKILTAAAIRLPEVYFRGYPNANCIGCVKATSPTYWNHVRRDRPEIFAERAKLSRELGARLVRYKGERIFLDELPPDAAGRPMASMNFECGIFCEEE